MKTLLTLSILIALSGCQITIARLPSPVDPKVAGALVQHAQNLDVLIADYKERHPEQVPAKK
jgi:hypothetical protein